MADKEVSIPETRSARRSEMSPAGVSRQEKLAAALRENLRRRKDQKPANKPAGESAIDPSEDSAQDRD